jgi:hypothetical protein
MHRRAPNEAMNVAVQLGRAGDASLDEPPGSTQTECPSSPKTVENCRFPLTRPDSSDLVEVRRRGSQEWTALRTFMVIRLSTSPQKCLTG